MPRSDVPKIDLSDRRILTFVTTDGTPLWDRPVRFRSGPHCLLDARTSAKGEVLFAAGALGLSRGSALEAFVDGRSVVVTPSEDVVVVPGVAPRASHDVALDVAICIDTTSSMDDEVEKLRGSLLEVVRRIGSGGSGVRLRVGGVAFRDVGDEFVTRPFDFTTDMNAAARTVAALRTGGGGDHFEAVHEGLDAALSRLSWSRDGAIRILFLIGDAGPHLGRGPDSIELARRATERGVQIVPIGCSGLDDVGELVWRQLAVLTLGRFLFVSYATPYGPGADHHVGAYEENDLDELMVRSVGEAVGAVKHPARRLPAPTAFRGQGAPTYFAPRQGPAIGFGRSPVDFGHPR